MRVVADTGPLVAALNRRDRAHKLSVALLAELGRDLIVPDPVLVEVDYLVRTRVSSTAARVFLAAMVRGEHTVRFLSSGLLRRAKDIDAQFAHLDLGLTDGSVMAVAERERAPILTYDFDHFRATRPQEGSWRLVVSESDYAKATA